jgi:hypothetical protein
MERIYIKPTDRVFVLTGAGMSAESGIPTFRDANGLWRNYRIEEVASPDAWRRDPQLVWDFYSMRRTVAAAAQPNPGHRALAALERTLGSRLFLCTQNVDNLHEQAGSRPLHMHGELFKSRCERCQLPFDDTNPYRKALVDGLRQHWRRASHYVHRASVHRRDAVRSCAQRGRAVPCFASCEIYRCYFCGCSDAAGLASCSGILAGVLTSGLSARNITRPLASSEYSKLFLPNVMRIPSTERSRGTSPNAQFTCSTAVFVVPDTGIRRIRNIASPPVGTGTERIGRRL